MDTVQVMAMAAVINITLAAHMEILNNTKWILSNTSKN